MSDCGCTSASGVCRRHLPRRTPQTSNHSRSARPQDALDRLFSAIHARIDASVPSWPPGAAAPAGEPERTRARSDAPPERGARRRPGSPSRRCAACPCETSDSGGGVDARRPPTTSSLPDVASGGRGPRRIARPRAARVALSASVHASADVKAEACAAATVEVPAWVRHVETLRLSDHDDNHVTRAIIASAEAGELDTALSIIAGWDHHTLHNVLPGAASRSIYLYLPLRCRLRRPRASDSHHATVMSLLRSFAPPEVRERNQLVSPEAIRACILNSAASAWAKSCELLHLLGVHKDAESYEATIVRTNEGNPNANRNVNFFS